MMRPLTVALALLMSCQKTADTTIDVPAATPEDKAELSKPAAFEAAPKPSLRMERPDAGIELATQLDAWFEDNGTHRLHVQLDRPLYRPGEAVWVKSWDLATRGMKASEARTVTYELLDGRGIVNQSKRVQVSKSGTATNDFVIPHGAAGGSWTLKVTSADGQVAERSFAVAAFQSPRIKKTLEFVREAYGPGDEVEAAITLERSTGEKLANIVARAVVQADGKALAPIYIETDGEGEALVRFTVPADITRPDVMLTVLVDDGGITESISRPVPVVLDQVQLAWFPEGGDWVEGLPARIYFEATDPFGEAADISGAIIDDSGQTVAELHSWHDGRGRAEFTPEPGHRYFARIDAPSDLENPFFPLPKPNSEGCVMRHHDDLDGEQRAVRVSVACTTERDVFLIASQQEQVLDTASVHVKPGAPATAYLEADDALAGAQGVARVTVLDGALQPMAERLVYRNRTRQMEVEITADKERYGPRDEVVLTVETRDPDGKPVPAELAMSVVDDTLLSFADDEEGNLLSRLLLEADLPDPIDDPGFFYDKDEDDAALGLDLVLGTRGWRKFDWVQVQNREQENIAAKTATRETLRPGLMDLDAIATAGPIVEWADLAVPMEALKAPMPAANLIPEVAMPIGGEAQGAADGPMPAIEGDLRALGYIGYAEDDLIGGKKDMRWGGRGKGSRRGRGHRGPQWAPVRVFPKPQYTGDFSGTRTDFRDTVLWEPTVATDGNGKAEIRFYLSDAVTGFKAVAEGVGDSWIGRGEHLIASSMPFHLSAKLPQELSFGDRLFLPVTLENQGEDSVVVDLETQLDSLLKLEDGAPGSVTLLSGDRQTSHIPIVVSQARGEASLTLTARTDGLEDSVQRTIPVVPRGFPVGWTRSGLLDGDLDHTLTVSDSLPGTVLTELTIFPSPVSTMLEGIEGMVRTPGGCFEQTSSTNYPNVLVLDYLDRTGTGGSLTVNRKQVLKVGYDKLTGYQVGAGGFETWGTGPGKEALSAYGLLQFNDMKRVYDVNPKIIERDLAYLYQVRDGKGGFSVTGSSSHGYGSAPPAVLNAYITWAMVETGQRDLEPEINAQSAAAVSSKDPYQLALATMTTLLTRPGIGAKAAGRLAGLQADNGSFPGSETSIMRSAGQNLLVESTALSAMALLKADRHGEAIKAIQWLHAHKNGPGTWGATQANVLALKALSLAAQKSGARSAGEVTVLVDDEPVGKLAWKRGARDSQTLDLSKYIGEGRHDIRLDYAGQSIPYAIDAAWTTTLPSQHKDRRLSLETELSTDELAMGETVRMATQVSNRTGDVVPDPIARIGLPAGLQPQTWQLEQLVERGEVAFYEVRPREVTLYWDGIAAGEVHDIDLDLVAEVPGVFTAPASSAFPYYDDSYKAWTAGATVRIGS